MLGGGVASRTVFRYSHGYGWESCESSDAVLKPENALLPPTPSNPPLWRVFVGSPAQDGEQSYVTSQHDPGCRGQREAFRKPSARENNANDHRVLVSAPDANRRLVLELFSFCVFVDCRTNKPRRCFVPYRDHRPAVLQGARRCIEATEPAMASGRGLANGAWGNARSLSARRSCLR